jgi:hypothetical protein
MTIARQYEGIFPYLIALRLEEHEIPWAAEVYLEGQGDDTEMDILYMLPGKALAVVECKTFATDVPARTIKSNITNSVGQLAKQVKTLQSRGVKVAHSVLATNYRVESDLKDFAESVVRKDRNSPLRSTDFQLVGLDDIALIPGLKARKA